MIQVRPILEEKSIDILVDPRLEGKYDLNEFKSMMLSAALCIRHSAHRRPQMSKVSYSCNSSTADLTSTDNIKLFRVMQSNNPKSDCIIYYSKDQHTGIMTGFCHNHSP